jgi:hypothetical protein
MATWNFMPQRPGETTREPIQGEFFATEAISNTAAALVREGNQNTMDAGRDGEKTRVRIFLSGAGGKAAAPEKMAPYLTGVWPHYRAHQNGLCDIPADTDHCPFLVFEDFGTTGLCGDPLQWHKKEGVKNGFFTFFRAEGQSDKEQGDRGRWGVGKFVFPRSSRVSSFLAVTVRHDDRKRLLMGRAILKTHAVDGQHYVADGYFGEQKDVPGGGGQIVGPVEDEKAIDQFCTDFGLKRGTEPGLSIVVPWYDLEITQIALLRAVIEDYFYPILSGDLEVTVEGPDGTTALTAATLIAEVEKLNSDLAAGMVPLINLAEWVRSLKPGEAVVLNKMPETGPPKWIPPLFPEDAAAGLRERYHRGEKIAVLVPFCVRPKGGEKKWSFFDVALERDGTEARERPVFVREGIIISDLRSPYSRGVRSLVICDDGPLATLLGDSENPAHTQWQKDGSNYKGKYTYPAENLAFVINSVAEVIRFITEADKEADKSILVDVFSLPAEPEDPDAVSTKVKKEQGTRPGRKSPPTGDPPTPKPKRFRVEKVKGGFCVRPGDPGAEMPKKLDIKVAYSIRSGNPLRVDKAVAVLGEVGNDGLAGAVGPQPRVLVVEHVPPVAHQVRAAVLLQDVDAVLTGTEQPVQLKIARVVVAHGVLVQHPRRPQDAELRQVAAEPRVVCRRC